MTSKVFTARAETSVLAIAQMMVRNRISCVVVVEDRDDIVVPAGIVTERDIVQLQGMDASLEELIAKDVMSSPVIELHPDDSLATAQQCQRGQHLLCVSIDAHHCATTSPTIFLEYFWAQGRHQHHSIFFSIC